MMINKIILIIVLIIVNNNIVNGIDLPPGYGAGLVDPTATCSNYIGDPIDQPLCKNKLPNPETIYTGTNITLQFISLKTVEKTFKSMTFLQSQCSDLNFAESGICDIYFPPCIITPLSVTPIKQVSLPQRLCKSVCTRMVEGCPALGASLNCSDPMKFPEIGTLYNLAPYGFPSGFYPVPCTDPTEKFNSDPGHMIEICPSPLLLKNSSDPQYSEKRGYTYLTPTNCVLDCPVAYFTTKKWHQMYNMSKVVSTISFVCCIYNIITFGILNRRRSKYNYCITFFSSSVLIMNLMDIVTYGIGYEKLICPEPGRSAVQDDVSCGVTGAIFHFGITNGMLWWNTMSICLYSVVKRVKLINFRYIIGFNTIFSLIDVIIPLSLKKFTAGPGGATLACWIRERWSVTGVFWIPMGILLTIGATCIILVIIEIYRISKSLSTKDNRMVLLQLKPFLCVTLVGGSFIYLFIFNFHNESQMNHYRAAIPDYVKCLLDDIPGEECTAKGPNFGAYFVFYFLIRLFGILFALIYGTSGAARDNWIHSPILNQPKIKKFLLKYNLMNFNSATGVNSVTNSKNTSKKPQNSSINSVSRNIELDVNESSIVGHSIKRDDEETTKGEEESNVNSASNTSD